MAQLLEARNITKTFHRNMKDAYVTTALNCVNLQINPGEFLVIMGKSGSGKSTLLRILSGMDQPSSGEVYYCGKNLSHMNAKSLAAFRRNEVGYIFQDYNLIQEITNLENIILPLLINRYSGEKAKVIATEFASKFGVRELLSKYPYELSGGEAQRLAIIRALMNQPKILFADEPTGNLDSINSKNVIGFFQYLNQTVKKTIVMVTHDAMVATYAQRILFLRDGEIFGEIHKQGKTDHSYYQEILTYLI